MFQITKIDPETGNRLDTYDDELSEEQLDAHIANAHETARDRNGALIFRFGNDWFTYLSVN